MHKSWLGLPDGCWIDGTDALVEGEWIWTTNGNTITSESYQKWFPGEPNSKGTGEDCMDLLHHENYNWNDESCEAMNNFLCEARFAKGLNKKNDWLCCSLLLNIPFQLIFRSHREIPIACEGMENCLSSAFTAIKQAGISIDLTFCNVTR